MSSLWVVQITGRCFLARKLFTDECVRFGIPMNVAYGSDVRLVETVLWR
jgi:hypothetical protein